MSKHFVIRGFNKEDIEEYAESILSGEKLMEFKKHLSIHPHIQSLMHVPLHSTIVMAVYLRHKQLPTTPTELYTWLVKTILSQNITDHPEYSREDKVHVLGLKLPEIVHTHFIQLSKFAFKNVTNNLYSLICQKNFMILPSQTQFQSYFYQKAVLTTFSTSASKSSWQRTMFTSESPSTRAVAAEKP